MQDALVYAIPLTAPGCLFMEWLKEKAEEAFWEQSIESNVQSTVTKAVSAVGVEKERIIY